MCAIKVSPCMFTCMCACMQMSVYVCTCTLWLYSMVCASVPTYAHVCMCAHICESVQFSVQQLRILELTEHEIELD